MKRVMSHAEARSLGFEEESKSRRGRSSVWRRRGLMKRMMSHAEARRRGAWVLKKRKNRRGRIVGLAEGGIDEEGDVSRGGAEARSLGFEEENKNRRGRSSVWRRRALMKRMMSHAEARREFQ